MRGLGGNRKLKIGIPTLKSGDTALKTQISVILVPFGNFYS